MCIHSVKETCFSQKYQKWIYLILIHWTDLTVIVSCIPSLSRRLKQIKTHHCSFKLQQGQPIYKNTCYDINELDTTGTFRFTNIRIAHTRLVQVVRFMFVSKYLWHIVIWMNKTWYPTHTQYLARITMMGHNDFPGSSILISVKNQITWYALLRFFFFL